MAPCETPALHLPSPLVGPFVLCRNWTKRGPKQWITLKAEWLCGSSTNPLPPSLTETQPTLVLLKRGWPSWQRNNERCLSIKLIKLLGLESFGQTNHLYWHEAGACALSCLSAIHYMYTVHCPGIHTAIINCFVEFIAQDMTLLSRCSFFIQALLFLRVFNSTFLLEDAWDGVANKEASVSSDLVMCREAILLSKSTDQLPWELLFINKGST